MILAIVLAAGASVRMGSPKALLGFGGKTFLQHLVDVLRAAGVRDIRVVVGADAESIGHSLAGYEVDVIVNHDWRKGQLSSVVAGLLGAPEENTEGILVCPVDHPLITARLIITMIAALETTGKRIVIPTFQGKRGHPALFSASMLDEIRRASSEIGLRQVICDHPEEVHELATDEEGVLLNIDSIADYERHVAGRKPP